MLGSPLTQVERGLKKGVVIGIAFLAAAFALGFMRIYVDYLYDPGFSVLWIYGYVAVSGPALAAVMGYQAYSVNPKMMRFVEGLESRVREADYVPWGTKKRGLMVTLDSGLLFTVSRNFLSFRIATDASGRVTPLTLDQWATVVRSFRGGTRRAFVTTRKGDPEPRAELQRIAQGLGGRSGMVSVFQRGAISSPAPDAEATAVAIFGLPGWLKRADAVRNGLDDIQRLLEGMAARPAS